MNEYYMTPFTAMAKVALRTTFVAICDHDEHLIWYSASKQPDIGLPDVAFVIHWEITLQAIRWYNVSNVNRLSSFIGDRAKTTAGISAKCIAMIKLYRKLITVVYIIIKPVNEKILRLAYLFACIDSAQSSQGNLVVPAWACLFVCLCMCVYVCVFACLRGIWLDVILYRAQL